MLFTPKYSRAIPDYRRYCHHLDPTRFRGRKERYCSEDNLVPKENQNSFKQNLKGQRRCRVANYEIIAGSETVTTHKEFGFVYRLDVSKVFFNPRLSYERMRLASLVQPGEMVLIPFCGAGPFAIPLASKGAKVLAVEKNTEACRWMSENVRLNDVDDKILMVRADAFRLHYVLKSLFDRAVIPTPYGCDGILDVVYSLMKLGASVHFYTFKKDYQIEGLINEFERSGFRVNFYRKCGNIAPGVCRWVFDLIKSEDF